LSGLLLAVLFYIAIQVKIPNIEIEININIQSKMTNYLYKNDLPDNLDLGKEVAIDTETLGLNNNRDRLCLIQISSGNGDAHLVQFNKNSYDKSPNLIKLLKNDKVQKIMHFARFDMAILQKTFGIKIKNIYCTKIASRIARTYSNNHGLKVLVREFLGFEISKKEQSSYWGAKDITASQQKYAASDVLYLHQIRDELEKILEREGRKKLFHECVAFLNTRVDLDLMGWLNDDIFSHSSKNQ
jgi:ribonuclease D